MARNICLASALVLGVGLAVAAPTVALAAPVDEIVVDTVPAGTERIIVDLEGAPAATSTLALRWRDDAVLTPLTLGTTPFGASAVVTPVSSASVGVQVSTRAASASLALTFVDASGAVIGHARHELPADDDASGGGPDGGSGAAPAPGTSGAAPSSTTGDLARTGGESPLGWLALGAAAIAAGATVLVARARRSAAAEVLS